MLERRLNNDLHTCHQVLAALSPHQEDKLLTQILCAVQNAGHDTNAH
jgi:hypothetical protein